MSDTDLPNWAWDLIDAIATDDDHDHRNLISYIPSDVWEVAAIMRQRIAERSRFAAEGAWHEGWAALADEERKQREDPKYPIGRDAKNPYTEVPF